MNDVKEAEVVDKKELGPVAQFAESSNLMLTENYIENAGKQIELRARLIQTALKALKPHDIQDFDGKPYIEGEGAARIMSVIRGFKVGEAIFKIDTVHPHYFVEASIPIEFMGATTVAIGDCSTADPFFCGKDGQGGQYKKHCDRTGSEAMAARLILGDAKKKARENAISRGVTELLGLKGLSWGDLEALGFSKSGAGSSVSFKKGSQGGEVKTISVSEITALAIGSVANLIAIFDDSVGQARGEKKIGLYTVKDSKTTITIQKWGDLEGGFLAGQEIYCESVKVSEYNGKKQYTAQAVRLQDEGANNGNAQ